MDALCDIASLFVPELKRRSRLSRLADVTPESAVGRRLMMVRVLPPTVREVVKEAFMTDMHVKWIVTINPDADNTTNHRTLLWYLIESLVRMCEKYGYLLNCFAGDKFLGNVGIIPPYKLTRMYFPHFLRSNLTLGLPPARSMGAEIHTRFVKYIEAIDDLRSHMPPHWYIVAVAVADDEQKKGVGKEMMEHVKKICKGYPIYLVCHDGNLPFYEKLGFEKQRSIKIDGETCLNSMLYNH